MNDQNAFMDQRLGNYVLFTCFFTTGFKWEFKRDLRKPTNDNERDVGVQVAVTVADVALND